MRGQAVVRAVGALAERQYGVVARRQLLALGISRQQIDRRCHSGAWTSAGYGVYAIGHAPLTRRAELIGACLAVGPGAALSHLSAAELWALVAGKTAGYHVTVPCPGNRRIRGITVHRRPEPLPQTVVHGIPVTTPAQTLLDCAAMVGRRATERMIDQADRRDLCAYADLHAVLKVSRGQRGAGVLRAVVAEHEAGSTLTRSWLEERFLALCRRHGIPDPRVNFELDGLTLDFFWPQQLVAVETDGWSSHRPRARFQHDIDRGNRLLLAGILPLRFSHHDVTRQPKATALALQRALRQGGPALRGA